MELVVLEVGQIPSCRDTRNTIQLMRNLALYSKTLHSAHWAKWPDDILAFRKFDMSATWTFSISNPDLGLLIYLYIIQTYFNATLQNTLQYMG